MKKASIYYCNFSNQIVEKLELNGYQAYYVGGCVRDWMLGIESEDVDIATNANLTQIKEVFPQARIVGEAFSVALVQNIEIATFRIDGPYSDYRHPDYVKLVGSIEDDLGRRDFTINALAQKSDGTIIDPYDGRKDLANRVVRFVGDAQRRLCEDPIRAIRACRFVAKIGGKLNCDTSKAIKDHAGLVSKVASERLQLELNKILLLDDRESALNLIQELDLLDKILPHLAKSVGVEQNHHHAEDCWVHAVKSVQAVQKKHLKLRLAVLLHDIAKPICKRSDDNGVHFFHHEVDGVNLAAEELKCLHYSNNTIEYVKEMIRDHMCPLMFEPQIKDSTIHRTMGRFKYTNIRDVLRLQLADIKGNLKQPFKPHEILSYLKYALVRIRNIERQEHALKITDLIIIGQDVQAILNEKPGPIIGEMLCLCYEKVIENPDSNNFNVLCAYILEVYNA